MLLDLPPEVLHLMMLDIPPDSFYTLIQTCKFIRQIGLSSVNLLRTQLLKLPGLRLPDQTSIESLRKAFMQRSMKTAWNGVEALSDIIVHRPARFEASSERLLGCTNRETPDFDRPWSRGKFNVVQACCPAGCDRGLLAAAADEDGSIHIYRIRKGRLFPFLKYDPRTIGLGDDDLIYFKSEIIRFQRCNNSHLDHIIVVYSCHVRDNGYRLNRKAKKDDSGTQQDEFSPTYHLVSWKMCKATNKPAFAHTITATTPDPKAEEKPPIATPCHLVTTEDYHTNYSQHPIAVIFRVHSTHKPCYRINIYQTSGQKVVTVQVRLADVGATDYDANGLRFPEPIMRARFTPGPHPCLLIYGTATAPMDKVSGCVNTAFSLGLEMGSMRRTEPKLFSQHARPANFRGIPLKSWHGHEYGVYDNGTKYCVRTILELVLTTGKMDGGYLVKYAEEQESCASIDLGSELPAFEFTVAAKLLGLKVQCASNLGVITALSKDKAWLAVASWDKVKLWFIAPDAFLEQDAGSLATPDTNCSATHSTYSEKQNKALQREFRVANDKAYTSNCAQGYFHEYARVRGRDSTRIVAIRPTELPSRGIIYSMAFASKNVLWAWTDRGLVKWSWGKNRSRMREDMPLYPVSEQLYA